MGEVCALKPSCRRKNSNFGKARRASWIRLVQALVAAAALAATLACGGGDDDSSSVTVSISPTTATLATSETVQFTATVTNATNTAVTWQVNDVAGGNFTVGTITATGLYRAPGALPSPATVTVSAVSQEATSRRASAQVTITQGTPVSITISPATATVFTGQTQQFSAAVTPTTNTAVIWQVNGVAGGNSTTGTITSTGLFIAPSTPPTPPNITVTAVSQADSSKTATANVTILPAKFITITPSNTTVPAGAQQTFAATADGQSIDVTWSLRCDSATPAGCGTITGTGVYTAPLSPPPGGDVIVTATTTDGTAPPAGAVVIVQYANGSLNGRYAFSFRGESGGDFLAAAGSISFDGSGNITGGVEDVNNNGFSTINITGGNYQIGSDGRGTVTVQTSSGTETWDIALVRHMRAFAIRSDSGASAAGTLDLQDDSQFTLTAVSGNYAFRFAGLNAGAAAGSLGMAGALTADGAGAITQGMLDVNSAGTASGALAITGTYSVPSSEGRGTLTLTSTFATQNFAYYVVDSNRITVVESDTARVVAGQLVMQSPGPFASSSFQGGFAFTLSGTSSGSPLGAGGVLTLDGAGNASSGTKDVNSNGTVQNGLAVTGTYAVADAATGRTTVTLDVGGAPQTYVFYPQAAGVLNLLQTDAAEVSTGEAQRQTGSPFTASAVRGNYAVQLAGSELTPSAGAAAITGVLVPNGSSAITGTLDVSANGTAASDATVQIGSYLVSSTGRGTATLQTNSSLFQNAAFNLYVVNSSTVLLLGTDNSRVLVGRLEKQD